MRAFCTDQRMHVRFTRLFLTLCLTAALAAPSVAAEADKSVKVENAWVRAPVAGQKIAGAYLELTSARDAAMVAVSSPAAASVEMHSSSVEGGVMRMRAVPRIELKAGQTVKLAPGGLHLMLIDLKKPLKPGEKVPLTLSVQPSGAAAPTAIELEAEVRAIGGTPHKH
jgi:periplasmic copper chaperone A